MLHSCIHHCCTDVPPLPPRMTLLLFLLLSLFQCFQMPAAPPDRDASSIDSCDSTSSSIAFQLPPASSSHSTSTPGCLASSTVVCQLSPAASSSSTSQGNAPVPPSPCPCPTPNPALCLQHAPGPTARGCNPASPGGSDDRQCPPEHPITRCPPLRCTVTVHRWPYLHHPLPH